VQTRELLIATTNRGKVREITKLLEGSGLIIRSLTEFPNLNEPVEDGSSFSENALIKARHYSTQTGLISLADDSGLEVDALHGRPGIMSGRYGGTKLSDHERNQKLLNELKDVPDELRTARFICVIAVVNPIENTQRLFEGRCEGRLAREASGSFGFGYDPVFIPIGEKMTFGELAPEIKEGTSHRAQALRQAKIYLEELFSP
jgi:XTP/dITP diphosphohydrolase